MSVPRLRFPGFVGEWEEKRLGDLFPRVRNGFVGTATPYYDDSGVAYLQGKNIKAGAIDPKGLIRIKREFHLKQKKSQLKAGDLLMVQSGHVGECAVVTNEFENANCHALIVLSPNKSTASEFIRDLFYAPSGQRQIHKIKTGNTIEHVLTSDLKPLLLVVPPLPEQKRIAAFLGVVDAKIAALRARILGLQTYKRGLMQALFSQSLRCTKPDGTAFPDWEEKRLGEVLHEHKAKSTGKEQVYSVSVHKGLVNQIEHLGRSFSAASTDHYNRVKPHDIVYTKSPTGDFPLGIIKQSLVDKDVIVSPLYGVFTPETSALGFMLHVYFESNVNVSNYLAPIVQKGAKNTINVTNDGFLSNTLVLPVSRDEQAKIAGALQAMDAKIAAVQTQVDGMQDFKKGLLQQMFV